MCSPVSEAFRATQTFSAPIQSAKSEEVGCRLSEQLNSLIGCVNSDSESAQCVGGQNTLSTLFFYALRAVIPCFHVLEY